MKKLILLFSVLFTTMSFAQVPSYVPANGLVGWWPFDGNANDESGNGNNGTVNGATLTADRNGVANQAYSFLNDKYRDCFEKPLNFAASEQLKFAPVVIVIDSLKSDIDLSSERAFEILHRTESGKKPQKYMIYKFLQDDKLKC
jgi:hypothetical protein